MIRVSGTGELLQAFAKLKGKDGKAIMRKGTRAGAKLAAAAIKQAIPSVTGTTRRSIKVRALKRSRKRVGHAVQIRAVDKRGIPYASFSELGDKFILAKHYQGDAMKREGPTAIKRATEVMRDGIEALAAKSARRAG